MQNFILAVRRGRCLAVRRASGRSSEVGEEGAMVGLAQAGVTVFYARAVARRPT